jgi:predicted dehydrogenase
MKGNYGDYYDGIYNAIRNDAEVPVSPEDALNVIKIIETAYISNAEKRVIEL